MQSAQFDPFSVRNAAFKTTGSSQFDSSDQPSGARSENCSESPDEIIAANSKRSPL